MRRHRTLVAAGAVSALLLASCAGALPESAEFVNVQVTYARLDPEAARIPAGGAVRWVNAAPDTSVTLLFSEKMAPAFTCGKSVGYHFLRIPGGYQSPAMEDVDTGPVTLPCPLPPGSYEYEAWLKGVGLGTEPEVVRKLRGNLVVE